MKKFLVLFAQILFFAVLVIICFSCDNETGHENFQKKHLPETHYILIDICDSLPDINAGIAKALEVYSINPEDFAEVIGIVNKFGYADSMIFFNRSIGLIESGNKCYANGKFNHGIIDPGDMLVYKCFFQADSIDICWQDFTDNAAKHGYTIVPPGLEIYKDFGSDNLGDSVFVKLIIGIKE